MRSRYMTAAIVGASMASVAAFANAPAAGTAPKKGGKSDLPAAEITAVSTAVQMPVKVSNRGSTSQYPFAALTAVGMSFGVKNRTRKNMTSIVSNANRKAPQVPKLDANNNPVFKTQEVKDAAGNVTKIPTQEPETVGAVHYVAVEVDPKTDPDGASVRVFRDR